MLAFLFAEQPAVFVEHQAVLRERQEELFPGLRGIYLLLPPMKLWSKAFADWDEADDATCLSAYWDFGTGRVRWAEGVWARDEMEAGDVIGTRSGSFPWKRTGNCAASDMPAMAQIA